MTTLASLVSGVGVSVIGPENVAVSARDLRAAGLAAPSREARVALVLRDPLMLIRAVAALDGQVAAMLLLSDGLDGPTAQALARQAGCGSLLTDCDDFLDAPGARPLAEFLGTAREDMPVLTRWLMTTSGTTGLPKVVPHDLRSLSRSVTRTSRSEAPIWGLLYDPTRFAGMQVILQALIGGGRLVITDRRAPLATQVGMLAREGVTHLSATPTLWRRLLMVPDHRRLALRQMTLGGEILDQSTLAALGAAFPQARISHIYASTEAGVGFSVADRLAGFPKAYLDAAPGGVALKVVDGILWLRPPGVPPLADLPGIEVDASGFVCSGDRVEARDGRILFLGRDNGVINVGGIKVHPERIEAVLAGIPGVVLAKVSAKRSPVTGALVLAEVQLAPGEEPDAARIRILDACRARLEREAVPAILRFVEGFEVNAAGKLARTAGEAG